jgi:ribosomal protein S24E
LPKIKGSDRKVVPKKEILLIREELGKVIGYRFYKESFDFFDLFFKKYELTTITTDYYKEIELLCASFVYEPYLYDRMKAVLPDIAMQIEGFVKAVILEKKISLQSLTYDWSRTDIIHLFFIVFKNQSVITQLSEENFLSLLQFTHTKDSALDYILYKLLHYFPINAEELVKKTLNLRLKELILKLTGNTVIQRKEIKKYYTFISSLPSREDFNSQMAVLRDNYLKQDGAELHDLKASFNHNISLIIANIYQLKDQLEKSGIISRELWHENRQAWLAVNEFIGPILSFAKSFNGFLKPYPYFSKLKRLEEGDSSIRGLIGYNNEVLFHTTASIKEIEKLDTLQRNMVLIQDEIGINTKFHELIEKPKSGLEGFLSDLVSGLGAIGKSVTLDCQYPVSNELYNIPMDYTDLLLTKELVNNVRNHASKEVDSVIRVTVSGSNERVDVKVENQLSHTSFDKSNGEGLKCLRLLAEFEPFGFEYASSTTDSNFVQVLTFKIIL